MTARTAWLVLALAFAQVSPAQAQESPVAASRFSISIDGVQIATFTQLEFLSLSVEGTEQPRRVGAVQLRRGYTTDSELWDWFERSANGSVRANVTLIQSGYKGDPVARYQLTQAWPSKIQISGLDTSRQMMETVTIVCEHIERVAR